MMKANQDLRDYMADHCVSQRMLANYMDVSQTAICKMLREEMSQKDKEQFLNAIDSIASKGNEAMDVIEETQEAQEEAVDVTVSPKFQIGDRVKIPSKANKVAIVRDIWSSLAKSMLMYTVENEDDAFCGMYAEEQLEPAPIPTEYSFEAHIEGNVAVVTMIAKQGEKTWVYARGHAHILHDEEVGMAQAVSYAAKRMFETLDKKGEQQIYFKSVR